MNVRTRFAPSPTGFLHLGGARTALFAWAYARRHGGTFILRIEDTDVERSTPEAVQAILDAMAWLGLDYDEGPFYQMQRMDRYRTVLREMLERGLAYRCYMSPAELDELRAAQMARGEKPRYDGRWRPENAAGKSPPGGCGAGDPVQESARRQRRLGRPGQGAHRDRQRGARRSGDRAAGRHADLQFLRRRRRPRHADHARRPRRRPRQQHAAADQHHPRAGRASRRSTRTSRRCWARTARSCPSATARSA